MCVSACMSVYVLCVFMCIVSVIAYDFLCPCMCLLMCEFVSVSLCLHAYVCVRVCLSSATIVFSASVSRIFRIMLVLKLKVFLLLKKQLSLLPLSVRPRIFTFLFFLTKSN